MKLTDRELKKEAKKSRNLINEEAEEWRKAVCARQYGNKAESKNSGKFRITRRFAIGWASSLVAIIVIATVLLVVFLPKESENPKKYFFENETTVESNLTNVNDDITVSFLNINPQIINYISLIYDSPSGDHLYYTIGIDDQENLLAAKLFVVVNKDYTLTFQHDFMMSTVTDEVNGFEIEYERKAEEIEEGIYLIECRAILTTSDEIYYIEYSGYSLDEEGTFLDWVADIIKAKN